VMYRGFGDAQLRRIRAGYLGNLRFLDTCIGTVYGALERLNLLRNTIVIYSSDHWEMGGDHGLFQKFMFFEPSAGVPLIVSGPGRDGEPRRRSGNAKDPAPAARRTGRLV